MIVIMGWLWWWVMNSCDGDDDNNDYHDNDGYDNPYSVLSQTSLLCALNSWWHLNI